MIPRIYDAKFEEKDEQFPKFLKVNKYLNLDDVNAISKFALPSFIKFNDYHFFEEKFNSIPFHTVETRKVSKYGMQVKATVDYNGDIIRISSDKLYCIATHAPKCHICGGPIIGGFLSTDKKYYQQKVGTKLSAVWSVGHLVKLEFGAKCFMTIDHYKPKSKGGNDNYSNLVPMCSTCNNRKGDFDLYIRVVDNPYL